jgi:ABC-type antimicrobial peptide transport system ATPase subunit
MTTKTVRSHSARDEWRPIQTRLRREDLEELEILAKSRERSVAAELRIAIRNHLAEASA